MPPKLGAWRVGVECIAPAQALPAAVMHARDLQAMRLQKLAQGGQADELGRFRQPQLAASLVPYSTTKMSQAGRLLTLGRTSWAQAPLTEMFTTS